MLDTSRPRKLACFTIALLLACEASQAQSLFTVAYDEGDLLGGSGEEIVLLRAPTSNSIGGWSMWAAVDDGGGVTHVIWGTLDGGAPGFLLREELLPAGSSGTFPSILVRHRMSDTRLAFDVRYPNGPNPCDWFAFRHGDLDVACLRDPSTIPPFDWSTFDDYALTPDDHLVAAFTVENYTIPGVPPIGTFESDDLTPALYTGDSVPGLAGAIDRMGALRLTERGSYACAVTLTSGLPRTVIANGVPIVSGNEFVQVGSLVQPLAGPNGPRWFRLRIAAAAFNGDWAVAGVDDGPNLSNGVLVKNGQEILREGQTYGGITLTGEALDLRAGPDGSILSLWTGVDSAGASDFRLLIDDQLLASQGDPADADGDGVADPNYRIDLEGLSETSIDEDRNVRMLGRGLGSDAPGGTVLFTAQLPMGRTFCTSEPNSTGVRSSIHALGTQRVAANDLRLGSTAVPVGSFGYYLVSRTMGHAPAAGGSAGTLCLGGVIGRFIDDAAAADASGRIELRPNLDALPASMGTFAAAPGETLYFQLWHRDTDGMGSATSNFSDGLALAFR